MKKASMLLVIVAAAFAAQAQSNFGIGTNTPAASAALDVSSTTQGILVPRMTTTARNNISSPAKGLMVYDSTLNSFYYHNGTVWTAVGGASAGPSLELFARKTAATQALPLSTTSGDILVYDNVITSPTLGSYSTSTNAYTVGTAGLYLIQTRNTVVPVSPTNNQVGTYNWLEVNGAAQGSYNNFYPTYVSNGSQGGVTPAAIRSSTSYTFFIFLNAGDIIKIRATGLNSGVQQTSNNDGGTQLMVIKL